MDRNFDEPIAAPAEDFQTALAPALHVVAKVEKADRQPASGLFINDHEISLAEPELQVPLDEKVSIQVQRKRLLSVFRTIRLRSTALRGRSEFELDLRLR